MTREEALKVLLNEWKCIDRNDGVNCDRKCESCDLVMDSFVLKDACNMTIKALEQQPCDDAISRILTRMWNYRGKHTTSIDKVAMEQIIRDELSSVTRQTNCEYDKSGYCYSDDSCNYQFGDSAEFCGIHEDRQKPETVTEFADRCRECGARYGKLLRKWIPVNERLPYPWDERYLVSLAWGGIDVMEYKSTGFHNYGSFTPVPIESIIAWMPLPKPYNPQESEDKDEQS